jgi:hypothetical protein
MQIRWGEVKGKVNPATILTQIHQAGKFLLLRCIGQDSVSIMG